MDRKQFYYSRGGFIDKIVGPYMDASLIPTKGDKIYQYDLTNSQLNCIENSDDIMIVFGDNYVSVKNNKGHLIYGNRLGGSGFSAYLYDHLYNPRRDKDMSSLSEAAKLATDAISGMTSAINSYYSPTTTLDYAGYSNSGYGTINEAIKAVEAEVNMYDYSLSTAISNHNELEKQLEKTALAVKKLKDKTTKPMENDEKENKNMKGFNFDFGTCENNNVRLSMYGLAIKNGAGEWVSYNPKSHEIINVDIFNMENGGKYLFKMPVGIKQIKEGDIVVHNKVPMFVTNINPDGKSFEVVDAREGECKTIIPTKNMFGFDVITKVVSLFGAFMDAPTADQPFGNMLPFLMLNDKEVDPMMAFMLMNQQNDGNMDFMSNPMMMYMLMKDNKSIDPMMFVAMGMMNNKTIEKEKM